MPQKAKRSKVTNRTKVTARKTSGAYTKASNFTKGVRWDEWWTEFMGSREASGELTYKTAWAFAKKKGRTEKERNLIYLAIGPKPKYINRKGEETEKGPIAWLGDWQLARTQANYWDEDKVEALQETLKDRMNALEIGRDASQLPVRWMKRFERWSDRIDEAFGGGPPGRKDGENERTYRARARMYFTLQENLFNNQMQALDKYLKCHGIINDNITVLANMAAATLQGTGPDGQPATLTTEQQNVAILKGVTAPLLMEAWAEKSRLFDIPLHDEDAEVKIEEAKARILAPAGNGKTNGKGNGNGHKKNGRKK